MGDQNPFSQHTFFVFGNLKPGARGPTAAATRRQAEDSGVGGVEPWDEQLPPSYEETNEE